MTAGCCPPARGLVCRSGSDGSFSLWSEGFGEGFHSSRGALREARETFLIPSQLERFPTGSTITVLELCVGTGSNLAVLLEACDRRGLQLDWIGLELVAEPLRLALSQPRFRAPWQANTLAVLEQLLELGEWQGTTRHPADRDATNDPDPRASQPVHSAQPPRVTEPDSGSDRGCDHGSCALSRGSRARLLWGDARRTLPALLRTHAGPFDLIWHDAFSPQRCPQLWTLEFLTQLTTLLRPDGRWISYSSAAAVRESLRLADLQLAALPAPSQTADQPLAWSGGTLASPGALPDTPLWRPLAPMELEHLASAAGEPYRDPSGTATAAQILAARQQAQSAALAQGSRGSSSAWRRRWGLEP